MICRHCVDETASNAAPQNFLMPFFSERRRHDEFRPLEIRALCIRLIQKQMLNQRFNPSLHRAIAGCEGSAQRFVPPHMPNVDMRTQESREAHEMMNSPRCHNRGTTFVMSFWAEET